MKSTTPVDQLRWDAVGMVGRSHEMEQVQTALEAVLTTQRASSLLIHGYSGTGKSVLALHAIQRLEFLTVKGKYDQNSSSRPFAGIVDATTELIDALGYDLVGFVADSLKVDEQQILATLVPTFGTLFRCESSQNDEGSDREEGGNGPDESTLIRFMGIFRRFLIAVCQKAPLIIFLDDLQWADDASRLLLDSIYLDRRMQNLLLIGAIRDGETTTYEPPAKALLPVTVLTIGHLGLEGINEICSEVLNMRPEETEDLSQVVLRATAGNPYYIKQFISSLYRNKLLRFSHEMQEFEWNLDYIQEYAKQSDSVVKLMIKTIKAMSFRSQIILVVSANMGHTFKSSVLSHLLKSCELVDFFTNKTESCSCMSESEVLEALDEAGRAGLVETNRCGVYRFTHDRVQQSAIMLLPSGDTGMKIKAKVGSLLLQMSDSGGKDRWMLFTATDLLMHNAPTEQASQVAAVCFKAAKTAAKQAAFKTAARFADFGWSLISKKMRTNYKLGIELLSLAAEMHYCCGSIATAKARVECVYSRAINIQDRFRANHVLLQCYSNESDYDSSVKVGIDLLRETGVNFPKNPGKLSAIGNLITLKRKLRGQTAQDLYNLPIMKNKLLNEALHLFGIIGIAAFFGGRSDVCVLISIKAMIITVDHGLCIHTPFAIAGYAMLESHLGNMQAAYDYAKVAGELSKRRGMEFGYCRTRLIICLLHQYLCERMHESVGELLQAVDIGMRHVDSMKAFAAMRQVAQLNIFVGKNLMFCEKIAALCRETMIEYKQFGQIVTGEPFLQLVKYLRSESADPSTLTGIYIDEDGGNYRDQSPPAMNKLVDLNAHQSRMILYYLLGKHDAAEVDRKKFAKYEQEPSTTYMKFFYFSFCALNFFAIAAQKGRKRAPRARPFVNTVKRYGKANGPDIGDMINLLTAEKLALDKRKVKEAKVLYDKAISGFVEGKLFLMEAIAYERLGMALQRAKDASYEEALSTSVARFEAYGATLKVNQLRKHSLPAVITVEPAPH